jgi:hypothetical protein
MDLELTHAQLVDETAPTIAALRRNITLARELALHMNQPVDRHDQALSSLNELEDEMKTLVQQEFDREQEERV